MRRWTLAPGQGPRSLEAEEAPSRAPGVGEVRVRVAAVSLNARDLMIAAGHYPGALAERVVPVSDGAGTVDAVGDGVTRFVPGDRVVIAWNPSHVAGPHEPWMMNGSLGALVPGVLAEEVTVREEALVALPDALSFEQAACLPCAGTTAWNALFEAGPPIVPGQAVLATGTGALSLIGVLLAKAAGCRAGVTSSNPDRIERARRIGADFGIDYTGQEWSGAVREATGGLGANVVLENAGPPSIAQSAKATAQAGRVCQIGWKGMEGDPIDVIGLAIGGVSVVPIQGGSRLMLERLVAAVAANGIDIPVDSVVPVDEAPRAFERLASGEAFGKVVVAG